METTRINDIYNADTLERVHVKMPSPVPHVSYVKYKKYLIGERKEGFYTDSGYFLGNEQDMLNGAYMGIKVIIINNIAYYRPYVVLDFVGGSSKIFKFDTVEECNAKAIEISTKYIKNQIQ
jgi:hypothetical protein